MIYGLAKTHFHLQISDVMVILIMNNDHVMSQIRKRKLKHQENFRYKVAYKS